MAEPVSPESLPYGEEVLVPPALRQAFVTRATTLGIGKGHVIVDEGAAGRDVYLIESGQVQVSRFSRQGREVILAQMGPGEIFGEMAAMGSRARTATVTATVDTSLSRMSREEFVELTGEVPQMGLWLARLLVRRIEGMNERVFELSTAQVAARVQSELLRLAHAESGAMAGKDAVTIDRLPTHAEMASRIGSHREAVSRELSLLAKQGLVSQQGRRLDILSISKLKALHDRISQ